MEKGRVDFKVSVVPFNRVTYMEKNIFLNPQYVTKIQRIQPSQKIVMNIPEY